MLQTGASSFTRQTRAARRRRAAPAGLDRARRAAGNAEMAKVHRDVTDRIRIIRRLDFTKQARIDATWEEHGKILKAIQRKRGDQAEVRKITLHQVHLARQGGVGK